LGKACLEKNERKFGFRLKFYYFCSMKKIYFEETNFEWLLKMKGINDENNHTKN
jgi:hypothetical protein